MIYDFAYVSFVNNNPQYIDLMKTTILSIKTFSQFPLILYCVNVPLNTFSNDIQIIIKHIDTILPNIYYYKPFVIKDAIENGVKNGYYIESDDVLTPFADSFLLKKVNELTNIPISPIHPDDVDIPYQDGVIVNSMKKTQHYIHGHVLFSAKNIEFIKEWLQNCLKYNNFKNADETVLNLLYWKYNCSNHYLDIIDPYYLHFYDKPQIRDTVCSFHGCKDPNEQYHLFTKMVQYYEKK